MTRAFLLRVGVVLLASTIVYGRASDPPYARAGRVPSVIDSESLVNFVFDPVGRRLYAQSREGVYWMDVREEKPQFRGPILPKTTGSIEIAPDLGRLYFSRNEETFGYLDLRTNETPKVLAGKDYQGGGLVYEPTRREIYTPVHFRGDAIAVYDAETGKRTADIKLPGYRVTALDAVPGKVFFSVENKSGLFAIDAATHTVAPWPINGRLVTPAHLEADPTGQYLFGQYDRHVVAIDVRTATVVADLVTEGDASFSFDPERRLLVVAAREIPDHPRTFLRTYSVSTSGFTQVADLKNPAEDGTSVYSMHGGFLQRGHDSLFLWLAAPASATLR